METVRVGWVYGWVHVPWAPRARFRVEWLVAVARLSNSGTVWLTYWFEWSAGKEEQ